MVSRASFALALTENRKAGKKGREKERKMGRPNGAPVAPHICQGRRDGGRGDIVETRIGIIWRVSLLVTVSLYFLFYFIFLFIPHASPRLMA